MKNKPAPPKLFRCGIYTRKSTDHNLDLEFNSLDAQREACGAYIKSQAHEGWRLGGGVVSTASPAAAAVRLLARGKIEARGALPPERCIEPEDMFPELERRGCVFRVETVEAVKT